MKNSTRRSAKNWRRTALLVLRQARRARRDPYEFARFAFTDGAGRPLAQGAVHRELQRFLGEHDRALIELPRDHGKTVQVCLRILWELGRRPALRIKVVCATDALAIERGRYLRDAIRRNKRLALVFPGLVPDQPWTEERFSVRRPADLVGPSVTALGVGAASTGTRADLLVCDDIVDVRALRSRADRECVKVQFRDNLVNLLEPDGRLWMLFTPWHGDDLNAGLKRAGAYPHFRRAVGPDLEPVWPEKWPRERLEERRREIGELSFARGYRLECLSNEAALIRPEWLQYWHEPAPAEFTLLSVDPAVSTRQSADATALVTLARGADHRIRCVEALARRVAAPQLIELIDDADRRWQPDLILFEANAAFTGMAAILRNTRFGGKVLPVQQTRDKSSRVQAFSIPVQNGTFLLHGGNGAPHAAQQALFDEMTSFPIGEHDDLLDAAATGTAYLLDQGRAPNIRPLG